jgi:hypothetical protein
MDNWITIGVPGGTLRIVGLSSGSIFGLVAIGGGFLLSLLP